MSVPPLKVEKERELRDSVALARARFLTLIRELRPHVITDLYPVAFPEYVFAVAEYFREQLLDKDHAFDAPAFLCLSKQIVQGIEAGHEPSWVQRLNQPTKELVARRRPELLIDHLKGTLSESLLVELVNRPLMRVISRLVQLGDLEMAQAFPDWHTAKNLTCFQALRNALLEWSTRWNLDADWCRDHALRVLRKWLFNENLRWTFLYANTDPGDVMRRSRLLASAWQLAAMHNEFAVAWSQASLSGEILEGDPEDFTFKTHHIQFTAPGFNPIL